MDTRFTAKAQKVILMAQEEAKKLNHDYVGTEHLLIAITSLKDCDGAKVLLSLGVDAGKIQNQVEKIVGIGDSMMLLGEIPFTPRAKKSLEYAYEEAKILGTPHIGTEHLLLGILREEEGIAVRILENLKLSVNIVRETILKFLYQLQNPTTPADLQEPISSGQPQEPQPQARGPIPTAEQTPQGKQSLLQEFGRDLTQMARDKKLDPVIGRQDEMERIIQILARRTKNNPVLLGEPGVGKTSIAEGLAQKIAKGDVPEILTNKRLVSLDLASIVAGTKYRGEFEQRLKNIINEIEKADDIIIFIDELQTIMGAGAAEGAIDASNMLKPPLSRGTLQCVGATSYDDYRKHIESDPALERRFQPVTVEAPNVAETVNILKGLKENYEKHHGIEFSDDALQSAAEIADKYITDRELPDKAIDLLDEAGSRAHLAASVKPKHFKKEEQEIEKVTAEKSKAILNQEYETAAKIRDKEEKLKGNLETLKENWAKEKTTTKAKVTSEDIAIVASKWTGIPVTKLTQTEADKILNMEKHLHEKIIGQQEAVKSVSQSIRRNRTGLGNPKRPIGGFLFLGPTGVGKTELAKTLAEFMFGDVEAMVRIDMSEYMEKFAVSRLIGAPPGYVGYEEGGQLTEAIRRRPYSVIVLDEMEKAHPDIYNILLQVLDEGTLTDNLGHKVSFKNSVIIMTSNVGARQIASGSGLGFTAGEDEERDYKAMKEKAMEEVKKVFNPEFINRVDEIIVFHGLNKEHMAKILDLRLKDVEEKLSVYKIKLVLTDSAKKFLVEKGYDPKYGARPLLRVLQKDLEDPLAEHILKSKYPPDTEVLVDLDEKSGDDVKHQKLKFSKK